MEERDFDKIERESFIGRLCGDKEYDKNQLCNYLGWQTGAALGTEEARAITQEIGWFYYRPFGLILELRLNHPVVASLIHSTVTGEEYTSRSDEKFLNTHLGFWKSSVARRLVIGKEFKLNAQERMFFKDFKLLPLG